jgi:ABC-2 type transport system permease protein
MPVLDLDHSQSSRALVSHFAANGRFDLVDNATSRQQVNADIDAGRAMIAVVIDAGFARNLDNGRTAPLQVMVDGTNSNTALIALGYISQIVALYQAETLQSAWPASAGAAAPSITISMRERPWYNEDLADRWFFIPGVIGTLAFMQVISLTAFAVVREREVGTLEQIMVSPIRPFEFILGKTLPFFLIGLADVSLVTTVGVLWFGVPFVGSIWVLLLGTSLFLLAALGMGLLLSTLSRTQQQAFALNFFLVNPFLVLSGFAFPIAAMPRVLQWFTVINPLRYFLVVIRAVLLKGVGLDIVWPSMLAMAGLGIAMLTLSILRFSKSLD